jgi:AraC-like DNA-binding protein
MSEDKAASGTRKPRNPRGTGTRRAVDTKKRAAEALRLRLRRHSYAEIAAQLGFSDASAARKAVEREIAAIPREPARELRQMELETLDAVQARLMPVILRPRPMLGAIDRLDKIMTQRAKLTGIYENLTDSGVDEFKTALKAWLGDLTASVEAQAYDDATADGEGDGDDERSDADPAGSEA